MNVTLCDGSPFAIDGLGPEGLLSLQWEQEQAYAQAIVAAPPRSPERQAVIAAAYDFIGVVLLARAKLAGQQSDRVLMGSTSACVDLAVAVLQRQVQQGFAEPSFFEVGYGSGSVISAMEKTAFPVGGIEISLKLREQAIRFVREDTAKHLLVGNVLDLDPSSLARRPSVLYWNDVMEHIAPDEALFYLEKMHDLLAPGGALITITPTWLRRPSDVTYEFFPPRTESRGLHLKEYKFSEVVSLMKQAGFARIGGPLGAVRGKYVAGPIALSWLKCAIEPILEKATLETMRKWTTRLAMDCTIAVKAK